MLDDLTNRVALDVLDERQLVLAVDVELEQRVGATHEQRDLVAGQRDVDGRGAVAVDHGRDLAGGTQAAGEALAEVLTQLGVDLRIDFGRHDGFSLRAQARCDAPSGARYGVFDSNASA